jgi:hypothetical protein
MYPTKHLERAYSRSNTTLEKGFLGTSTLMKQAWWVYGVLWLDVGKHPVPNFPFPSLIPGLWLVWSTFLQGHGLRGTARPLPIGRFPID